MVTRQVEDRMFPTTRCDVEAVRYWREPPRRLAQRWYIQLCLLASSVHDRFLACEEAARGNKNWSATMSYYSIVHGCRSIVFQCFGDFPKRHDDMARFIGFDGDCRNDDRVRFNWLSGFPRRPPNQRASMVARNSAELDTVRRMLCQYYRETLQAPRVADSLERFGPLVADAKSLREDSNYEALLIAHEKDHFLVPRSLGSLCEHLSRLASVAVDTARDALVAGLRCDPDIENDRHRIQSLAHEFINGRFELCIGEKLSGDTAESFRSWLRGIGLPNGDDGVETIWDDVSYAQFDQKQTLMDDYTERIGQFGQRTHSITEPQQYQGNQPSDEENGG